MFKLIRVLNIIFVIICLTLPALAVSTTDYAKKGFQSLQKEEYIQALGYYTKALEEAPRDPHIYRMRAEVYQYLKQYDKAFSDLSAGLKIDPHNADLYEGLGWLYLSQKDFEKAKVALNQALEIDPEHLWAQLNLAHTYLLNNEYMKAMWTYGQNFGREFKGRKYEELILKDLKRLKKMGLESENFQRLQNYLKQKLAIE